MDIKSFLQTSINEYTDIQKLMEAIADSGSNIPVEELSATGSILLKKQQKASHTDKKIMQLLSESPHLLQDEAVTQRTQLLQTIAGLNKRILPRLNSIQSLITCELKQIKNGRSAMKGYQLTERQNGGNLNNTL